MTYVVISSSCTGPLSPSREHWDCCYLHWAMLRYRWSFWGRKVSVSQASFCTAAQTRDFIQKFLQLYTSLNSLLAVSIHSLALSQILVQEIDLSKNKNVSKGEVSDYLNSFRTSHSCISLYTNSIHYSTEKIFVARNNRLASRSRHPRHLSQ